MDFRIKEICREQGIYMKDLASRLGITEVGLSKSLNGDPGVKRLQEIADILNVPITDLFERPKQNIITCPKCGTALEIKEKESYNVDEDPLLQ